MRPVLESRSGRTRVREMLLADYSAVAKDHRTLNCVLEFTHISRPRIIHQRRQRVGFEFRNFFSIFLSKFA